MSTRVLVTGAAGGIGAAAAAELRRRGARVIGLDLRPDGEGDVIACDVRDQGAVDRAVSEAIERLGGLDVLINNAGLGDPQSAGLAPDERALAVLDVNLIGPWRVTAAALPALREAHGRVVNVASGLSHLSVPFAPAYCMSKRGLVAYSDALRLEHGDAIAVTTVYPATSAHRYTRPRVKPASGSRASCRRRTSRTPRGRWCAPRSAGRCATSLPPAAASSPTDSRDGRRAACSTGSS